MHEFGPQLCLLISRDSKHISPSLLQMVIRLPGLVTEVAPGDWGAGGEKRNDCKKKLSEKDDGQPDGGILGAGVGGSFLLEPAWRCLPSPALWIPISPSCGHFNTGGMSGFNVRSTSK